MINSNISLPRDVSLTGSIKQSDSVATNSNFGTNMNSVRWMVIFLKLFSPAYRRTLETEVSVSDDDVMSDDFTQPGILVIVWEPEHNCLVSQTFIPEKAVR